MIGLCIYIFLLKKLANTNIVLSIFSGTFLLLAIFTWVKLVGIGNGTMADVGDKIVLSLTVIVFWIIYYILTFSLFIINITHNISKRKFSIEKKHNDIAQQISTIEQDEQTREQDS